MKNNSMSYGLVGDIGGTHARFALVDMDKSKPIELIGQKTLLCIDYPNIDYAARDFLQHTGVEPQRVHTASIAIAGVVDGDWFEMTNNHWKFSIEAVSHSLNLDKMTFLNDFAAVAWSLPTLREGEWIAIGGGKQTEHAPVAVLGAGTGLGVSGYVPNGVGFQVLHTEGGHLSFAPVDEQEMKILRFLADKFPRVSCERLLSGPGLEHIYAALAEDEGVQPATRTAVEITNAAISGTDAFCTKVLNQFCAILGSVSGDIALIMGARGGVYIAGGIVPRFIDFLKQSPFRERFEAKGRLSNYTSNIATRVVTAPHPGMLGAAAHERAKH